MVITVCDACGKSYKKYSETSYGEGSGISIISRTKDGKVKPALKLDLCPSCMEDVWSFIREDLIKRESLRYEEICGEMDSVSEDGEIGEVVASSEEE